MSFIGSHRVFETLLKQLFSGIKLVLQNNCHGLSHTVVRHLSGHCVFLNLFSAVSYNSAIMSLFNHAPNWILSQIALQKTGTLQTTWRYSDLIFVKIIFVCREFKLMRMGACKKVYGTPIVDLYKFK